MPVETRETQPVFVLDQPAHPDKGGTEAFAPGQPVNPPQANAFGVAVDRVPVGPSPQANQLSDHGVIINADQLRQPYHCRVISKVVPDFEPTARHPFAPTHAPMGPMPQLNQTCQNQPHIA